MYFDNIAGPVVWDNTSAFSLDGQRLIAISNYGTDSIVYRTEIESYNHIVGYNIQSWGPAYFKVYAKSGLIKTYGNPDVLSSYSPLFNKASTDGVYGTNAYRYSWNIVSVEDRNGNTINYEYVYKAGIDVGNILVRIAYGTNKNNSSAFAPLSIYFTYEKRPDEIQGYLAGKESLQQFRLSTVTATINENEYRKYKLNYTFDRVSRLTSLRVYQNGSQLFNPMTFTYGRDRVQERKEDISFIRKDEKGKEKNILGFSIVDIDGDGYNELGDIYTENDGASSGTVYSTFDVRTYEKNWVSDRSIPLSNTHYNFVRGLPGLMGDFNGNNSMETVFSYQSLDNLFVRIEDLKDGSTLLNRQLYSYRDPPFLTTGNFYGDCYSSAIIIHNSNPSLINGSYAYKFDMLRGTNGPVTKYPPDVNGVEVRGYDLSLPGKIRSIMSSPVGGINLFNDLLVVLEDNRVILLKNNQNGNSCFAGTSQITLPFTISESDVFTLADLNQDSQIDIIYRNNANNWFVALNKGNYTFETKVLPINCKRHAPASNTREIDNVFIMDINNDGLPDIIVGDEEFASVIDLFYFVFTYWRIYLNNGQGGFTLWKEQGSKDKSYYSAFGDLYRKGSVDWVYTDGGGDVYIHDFGYDMNSNLLTNVNQYLSGDEVISYVPLKTGLTLDKQNDYAQSLSTDADYLRLGFKPVRTTLIPVVKEYSGGKNNISYEYGIALNNWSLRGLIGFKFVELTDNRVNLSNLHISKLYNTSYQLLPCLKIPYKKLGMVVHEIGREESQFTIRSLNDKRYEVTLTKHNVRDDMKGNEFSTLMQYDNYGNMTFWQVLTRDCIFTGVGQEIEYGTYGSWCPNKMTKKTLAPYNIYGKQEKITTYKYNQKTGDLIEEISDPGDRNELKTEYLDFNVFGHPQTIRIKGSGQTRSTSYRYTSSGRFLQSVTNPFGETITYDWDETRCLLKSETGPLGTTSYEYNNKNVLTETTYPDHTKEKIILQWAATGNEYGAKYYSRKERSGAPPLITYYDFAGQELAGVSYGFNEQKITVFSEYYPSGQFHRISAPTFGNTPQYWDTSHTYDDYGRVKETNTLQGQTTYTYLVGLNIIDSPHKKVRLTNYESGLIFVYEQFDKNDNDKVNYLELYYHPSGHLKEITPSYTPSIHMEYDLQGNRTRLDDPDAGVVETEYNAFGQIVSEKQVFQPNGVASVTRYEYDDKGRLEKRIRGTEVTAYKYDSKNRLEEITMPANTRTYVFDEFNRVKKLTENITGEKTFVHEYEYDPLGRMVKEIFPSGYYVTYNYDSYGFLVSMTDKAGRNIWKCLETNVRGQVIKEERNKKEILYSYNEKGLLEKIIAPDAVNLIYVYDTNGNLKSREDLISNQKEIFTYDGMNRLATWEISKAGVVIQSFSTEYEEDTGNMIRKSDLWPRVLNYGEDNQPPHALSSVTHAPSRWEIPLSVTYTDFKKVKNMTQNYSTYDTSYDITYGVDDQRVKSVEVLTSGAREIYHYSSTGNYEEQKTADGRTRKNHFIYGGNGLVAISVAYDSNEPVLYFAYTDYQGSLTATTRDYNHEVLERYAYDPWGKSRNPDNWINSETRSQLMVNRGYTMHEQMGRFNLINMNGRIYDPVVASFRSPDPNITDPTNWLAYNRYSYGYHNPMFYTDPTGESVLGALLILGGLGFTTGYVSYGITTGNWGMKAVYSGLAGAAMSVVGYGCAYGFSSAAFTVSNSLAFSANSVANQVLSSFVPSFDMEIGDLSLSLSVASMFTVGTHVNYGLVVAPNLTASYRIGEWTLTGSATGAGYQGTSMLAGGVDYLGKNTGFSLYSTTYGGDYPQRVGGARFINKKFSFTWENDAPMFGPLSDGNDRFRSNATEIGIGEYIIGTNIFTNQVKKNKGDSGEWTHNFNGSKIFEQGEKGTYKYGKTSQSPFYIGKRINGNVLRIGINKPVFGDFFQNGFHKLPFVNSPFFNRGTFSSGFFQYGNYNPFSLY